MLWGPLRCEEACPLAGDTLDSVPLGTATVTDDWKT